MIWQYITYLDRMLVRAIIQIVGNDNLYSTAIIIAICCVIIHNIGEKTWSAIAEEILSDEQGHLQKEPEEDVHRMRSSSICSEQECQFKTGMQEMYEKCYKVLQKEIEHEGHD